jgi:hypothetical protein
LPRFEILFPKQFPGWRQFIVSYKCFTRQMLRMSRKFHDRGLGRLLEIHDNRCWRQEVPDPMIQLHQCLAASWTSHYKKISRAWHDVRFIKRHDRYV